MNKKFLPFVLLFFFLVILIKYGPLLLLLPDQARRDRIAYYQLQFENQRTAYLDAQPSRVLPFLSFNEISPKIEKKWNEPFSLIGSENYNRNRFYIIIKRHPDFFQKVDFITLTNNSDKILSVKYTFDLRKLSFDNQKEKNDNVIINVPIEFLSKNSDTLFPVVCKTYFVDSTLINNPVQYISIK